MRPCVKQISAMSRTKKGKTCQTGKPRGLIILNIKKKGFTPNRNFGNNNSRNVPNKKFQGNKTNSQQNPTGPKNK